MQKCNLREEACTEKLLDSFAEEAMLASPSWTSVKDNLRSITFHDNRAYLARLPTILEGATKVRFVSIRAANVGTAEEPLLLKGGITTVSKL